MKPILEQLRPGARVGIIRLRSLGDCVLTTPALTLLKQYRPDLRVAVVVEERFADVFRGHPHVDAVLSPNLTEFLIWGPHLSINFHGGSRSLYLTLAGLSRHRAGFGHYRHQWAYNVKLPRAQQVFGQERPVHTAEHLASAMFALGVPLQEIPRASLFAPANPRGNPLAVIHAVASAPDKAWRADGFLAVAAHLEKAGLEVLFLGAPGEDLSAFRRFETVQPKQLRDTIGLLQQATLFVGNDSGPAHMAAACGLPVCVLFGPSQSQTWYPWKTRHVLIDGAGSMANIAEATVLRAVDELLEAA